MARTDGPSRRGGSVGGGMPGTKSAVTMGAQERVERASGLTETFSKSFSKGVKKGLAQVVTKYLQLRGKNRIFFIKKRA
jgi:hypothetical protein